MALGVRLFQVGDGEFRVVADGVEGLVAEQFLDVVEVGPGPDQLGGAGPAEGVRGDVDIKPGPVRVAGQAPGDDVVFQPPPVVIEEQRPFARIAREVRTYGDAYIKQKQAEVG